MSVAILPLGISWFPRLSLIFQKGYVPKLELFPSPGERVGSSYSSGWNKLLNQCLYARPKFTCLVMENSSFCKISRSRCLPNPSPEDRDIPFPSAFFLGIPDGARFRNRIHCFGLAKPATFHIDFFFFVCIILKQVLNMSMCTCTSTVQGRRTVVCFILDSWGCRLHRMWLKFSPCLENAVLRDIIKQSVLHNWWPTGTFKWGTK